MKKVLMSVVIMGMATGAYAVEFRDLSSVKAADIKALAATEGAGAPAVFKGSVEPVDPATQIEWVSISGGKFTMGTTSIEQGFEDAKPIHEVAGKSKVDFFRAGPRDKIPVGAGPANGEPP